MCGKHLSQRSSFLLALAPSSGGVLGVFCCFIAPFRGGPRLMIGGHLILQEGTSGDVITTCLSQGPREDPSAFPGLPSQEGRAEGLEQPSFLI